MGDGMTPAHLGLGGRGKGGGGVFLEIAVKPTYQVRDI